MTTTPRTARKAGAAPVTNPLAADIRPGQSIELLKELHILTRDGKLNQDSRRRSSSSTAGSSDVQTA